MLNDGRRPTAPRMLSELRKEPRFASHVSAHDMVGASHHESDLAVCRLALVCFYFVDRSATLPAETHQLDTASSAFALNRLSNGRRYIRQSQGFRYAD